MVRVPARLAVAFACSAVVTLAVGTSLVLYVRGEITTFESTRRVNGDVVILAYTPSFPDGERIRDAAARRAHVERAGIFAIRPVQIESTGGRAPGLLKLAKFDEGLVRQLRMSFHEAPRPSVTDQPVELAVGESLAGRLRLDVGDFFVVHVTSEKDASSIASVRCRVRSINDWGHGHHNGQLLYGDLGDSPKFAFAPVGVELLVKQPELRQAITRDLQSELGPRFKVMSLEDLQAAKASSSRTP